MFKLIKVMFAFTIAMLLGGVASAYGFNGEVVTGLSFLAAFIPKPAGVLAEGINVEIWQNFIIGNLYKDNAFIEMSTNEDMFVTGKGRIVHIANAGAASGAERNRTVLPAAIKRRSDTDGSYFLDEFTSNPLLITDAEEMEVNYNKMESILSEELSATKQLVAEWMLYNWRAEGAANIVSTTGEAVATHLVGATGNRKAITAKDISNAQAKMDAANVPQNDRFILLDAYMYQQLVDGLSATQSAVMEKTVDATKGIVGELYGFKIMKRSTVLSYNGTTAAMPGATNLTTTNAAALCWQKDQVAKATGAVKMFESKGEPTMYGDVYSYAVNAGGRKRRHDGTGVIAIVQAASA